MSRVGETMPQRAGSRGGSQRSFGTAADVVLAALVVAVVGTMVVPLPLPVLDVLLALNLGLAVVLLLAAVHARDALGLAAFPTVLLVTTLYRLALDVAATRAILGHGDGGHVIRAFGRFVVAGNFVVGAVVFVILTLVQFLVIARGAERVAEVAARFTLDAMPGKQMAIDAELRAGGIDATEARRRRAALARESAFHGAMDGAMKFVKGDAIASIVVALVNIVGGLAIGVLQRGMDAADALRTYGLMTIGQGLVAQIPALVVSTAAGVLVTRVASEDPSRSLGEDIGRQLVAQPRALGVAALVMLLLAVTPGMPPVPFLVLGALLAWGARAVSQREARAQTAAEVLDAPASSTRANAGGDAGTGRPRDPFRPGLVPVSLEIGNGHAAWLDPAAGGSLRELVPLLREALFRETGVAVPGIRVRVLSAQGDHDRVVLRVAEVPALDLRIPPGHGRVTGEAALEAARAARIPLVATEGETWAPDTSRAWVESSGGRWIPGAEAVLEIVAASLRGHTARFVGIQEVQNLLDALEPSHPALLRAVLPKPLSVPLLAEILRRLAEEGVSIRALPEILEGLAAPAQSERDPLVLAEHARQALRRSLSHRFAPDGVLAPWLLSPDVTEAVRESIARTPTGTFLRLDPSLAQEIRTAIALRLRDSRNAPLLVDADVRRFVWVLVQPAAPGAHVLSYAELESTLQIQPRGVIGP